MFGTLGKCFAQNELEPFLFFHMIRTFTSQPSLLVQILSKGLLALLVSAFFYSTASGQNDTGTDLGYLSSTNWKTVPNLNISIAQEQSKVALTLSAPNMPLDEKALFLSYQRMLTYIQTNLQAGNSAHEAIKISYAQVLAEAPKDPALSYLTEGMLAIFLPALVESLTQTPIPGN